MRCKSCHSFGSCDTQGQADSKERRAETEAEKQDVLFTEIVCCRNNLKKKKNTNVFNFKQDWCSP